MKEKQLLPIPEETRDQQRFPFFHGCRRIWDEEALAYYPTEPDDDSRIEDCDAWGMDMHDFGDQD